MCARAAPPAPRPSPRARASTFDEKSFPESYRREQIALLQDAIQARESRLLIGLPQIGISSLLRFVATRLEWSGLRVHCAYVNCDAPTACADLDAFYERIAEDLVEHKFGKLNTKKSGYAQLEDLLRRTPTTSQTRIVIIVDEADALVKKQTTDFYAALEWLTDLNNRVSYFFAVKPRTVPEVDPEDRLFAGRHLYIPPLNARDLKITLGLNEERHNVTLDENARAKLARLSGGHPGLLRGMIPASLRLHTDWSADENVLVEQLIAERDVQARCKKIWQALDGTQQKNLQALARNKTKGLDRHVMRGMQQLGMTQQADGAPRIFALIFEAYVLSEPEDEMRELRADAADDEAKIEIVIDRVKRVGKNNKEIATHGRVFVNGKQIQLRPQEFELLALLTQVPGMHYYDEIQNVVLEGGAGDTPTDTTKGSQELQNLVTAVRRKFGKTSIKNHPANGYEFVGAVTVRRSDQ